MTKKMNQMTETTTETKKIDDWWNENWYKEWEILSRKDYQGYSNGHWICYMDRENHIIYKYIDNIK